MPNWRAMRPSPSSSDREVSAVVSGPRPEMTSAERSVLESTSDCVPLLRRPIRIAFVITGLEVGGAEMMLWKLLTRMDRARFEPCVLVLNSEENGMLPAFRQLA